MFSVYSTDDEERLGEQMSTVRKRTWTNKVGEKTAWVTDYFDQAGRRHIKTFETKKAAVAWLDEAKIEVKRGVHTPENSSITVTEAGELWLAQSAADGLEASTTRQYRQHLDYHINPLIGSVKLADLTVATVRHFRNTLINPQRADQKPRSRELATKAVSSKGACPTPSLHSVKRPF